jgi:hypothetical protein
MKTFSTTHPSSFILMEKEKSFTLEVSFTEEKKEDLRKKFLKSRKKKRRRTIYFYALTFQQLKSNPTRD